MRKRPAHGVLESDHGPTIVFDTVCTKDRVPVLASEEVHTLLREAWPLADAWRVGRYVLMPDHLHYFAANADPLIPFELWVRYWKSRFTKIYRKRTGSTWPARWQSDDWDVTIRSWWAYDEKWEYVRRNPLRHNLVSDPAQWPFQGELHHLQWE